MSRSRRMLWLLWATSLALLGLEVWVAQAIPPRDPAWHSAESAVASLILALFSLAAGVGTFALREPLALKHVRSGTLDPDTPAGFARIGRMLMTLWFLCLLIGAFGSIAAWGAASLTPAWPYFVGAAALLVIHAPRRWLFATSA